VTKESFVRRIVLLSALAVVLAACGSSSKSSGDGGSAGEGRKLAMTIESGGCENNSQTVDAGPVTVDVTNKDADDITELEFKRDGHIVGEKENLTPGLSGSFSLTLKEGTYDIVCPDGKNGTLTVKAATTGTTAAPATTTAAVDDYKTYVKQQTALLVSETQEFVDAVKAGDVAKAKAEFPNARAPYERIEPVAESFGDLDPQIDAREGDVPAAEWGGFHRIEKQLWQNNNTTGMAPVADKLLADVKTLDSKIDALELEPAQIANGAVELLNEVAKSKITGEEDRYSHTDLWDFEANVQGAQEAFNAVKPIVTAKQADIATKTDAQFAAVLGALAKYKQGDGYVLYNKLTKDDTKTLSTEVDTLADALAKVPPLVVNQPS
jgi:iron uptake system component EfeO